MSKTSNALEILKRRTKRSPALQRLYEEEKVNYQVAMLIRKVREDLGLTQGELAKRIGTTQSVISRLEDADYEGHSLSILQRIASALKRKIVIKMDPIKHVA